jgi:pimeloyl-ACP methyl ester carboxylesterase
MDKPTGECVKHTSDDRIHAAGMLLIHGAWQGSWAWDAWLSPMQARGWAPRAVDLPGNGAPVAADAARYEASLEGYVAYLKSLLEDNDGPVVVVAHSGAGVIASQLAEACPQGIACIVYVAGMMLPAGMGYGDLVKASEADVPGASGIAPWLVWSDQGDVSSVPVQTALEIFLHDCPPDAAQQAAHKLTPQRETGRALTAHLSEARFGRVPRIYVEALRDRSVLLPLQRRMQALVPGAHVYSIDTGHVPQLASPEALADIVCEALDELHIVPGALQCAATAPGPSIPSSSTSKR